jgi:nitroreductase/dihydropteridine reductase
MNEMLEIAKRRYATKHYDPTKRISDKDMADLLEILRLSPSGVNVQPWHFFVAGTQAARERLMPAFYDFNIPRVRDASHVIVFAVRTSLDDAFLHHVIDKEDADGRFANAQLKEDRYQHARRFVVMHREDPRECYSWATHQAYIALGTLVYAAAGMGIDSTCIEGLDFEKMDEILGLREKGLRSCVAVSLGYRAANDGNAARPKSRLDAKEIFTFL